MQMWRETYEGGDAQAEQRLFERLADDIMHAQLKTMKANKAKRVDRAFHAKAVLSTRDAELVFHRDLPADLQAGFAQPGAGYRTTVRFSNAAGAPGADFKPDLRGVALRVEVSPEEHHDLLATNFPVSHARNARQFVAFAVATAGGTLGRIFGLLGLLRFGPSEVARMLGNVSKARRRKVHSLALETYWSRGAMRWGPELAVRFLLRPAAGSRPAPEPSKHDPDYLSHELTSRLSTGDVVFELCLQRFVDERSTPIEDTGVEWTERASPPIPVASLHLRQQDVSAAEARANATAIEAMGFNPWNTTDEFRPLGNLNRARKQAYDASAHHRQALRWRTEAPLHNVITTRIALRAFAILNRFVAWHRLPVTLGLLNLDVYRHVLRQKNLIDLTPREAPPETRSVPPPIAEAVRVRRNYDGRYNDLSDPWMGSRGAAFGRNMAPIYRPDLFDTPNPVEVSQRLLTRKTFLPARSLNILAAGWIQFQVHDWVNHARHPLGADDVSVPLPYGTRWRNTPGGPDEDVMRIAGNMGRIEGGQEILFSNNASHWWDGSEVYGANDEEARKLRDGAKLKLDPNGYLPEDVSGMAMTGFNESWWLGLGAMHTLFAREHNVICGELKRHYPDWDEDRIYETARLIVSALIAKIHTVEWTPAILGTKTIDVALNANWNGPPNNPFVKFGIWLLDVHAATGIPKTKPDHHTARYSLTEDFATVYRLHPLIPDDYCFFHHATGAKLGEQMGFLEIQGHAADQVLREKELNNVLYSLGIAHPGAIALHNFPRALQQIERTGPSGKPEIIDLSVIDLVRTRRRGVPRYNDFLTGLHRPRVTRWEDLTASPESVAILKDVYKDIDMVDTVVGLLAETAPEGFGFSDTAFRIFLLMATRRIQSDRFLTVDFRPEVYSPFGMDWIANNGMTSVILRHCPELAAVIPSDASAFAPWRSVLVGAERRDPDA